MRRHKIWLPDMDAPSFIREARRESLAIVRGEHARADQDFIDSISILPQLPEYGGWFNSMKRGEIWTVSGGPHTLVSLARH